MQVELHTPITDEEIMQLKIGDSVTLSGIVVSARDAANKWLFEKFIDLSGNPSVEDRKVFENLRHFLIGGLLYHCGPIVSGLDSKQYRFIAAGPTTSIRQELYTADVMRLFNLKGIIGKGGMGQKTLEACTTIPSVYFHATGGAAALIAETVKEVLGVYKLEFGVPEAMWVVRVEKFPVVVTMDSHGSSLHENVRVKSKEVLDILTKQTIFN